MPANGKRGLLLIAEDDESDALLLKKALSKAGIKVPSHVCRDGEQVLAYLTRQGEYADREKFPAPSLMVLDLKMPRKNGFDVLQWIRDHKAYLIIPKIVMSSSSIDTDILLAFELGAHGYFKKPASIDELVRVVKTVCEYWELSEVPSMSEAL